jgi:hypothetical protein
MRRVLLITAAGLSLAGCSSFSDTFKSAPEPVTVQFESTPPGAEAKTSIGPACTTPCSLPIVAESGFEVTFTLPKFQPMTVPVAVTRIPGDFTTPARTNIEPSPVVAELQPVTPPRRGRKAKKHAAAPAAATTAAATTPFPNPQ